MLDKFSDKWSIWGLFFKVEAEITVNSLDGMAEEWMNVFHFTNTNDDGGKIPALYINKNGYFHLYACGSDLTQFNFKLGKKYHIVLQQYQFDDNVIAEIKINGMTIKVTENNQAQSLMGVKLYISDPWHPVAFTSKYGFLENFKVTKYSKY